MIAVLPNFDKRDGHNRVYGGGEPSPTITAQAGKGYPPLILINSTLKVVTDVGD